MRGAGRLAFLIALSLTMSGCGLRAPQPLTAPAAAGVEPFTEQLATEVPDVAPPQTSPPPSPEASPRPSGSPTARPGERARGITYVVPTRARVFLQSELRNDERIALLEFESAEGAANGCESVGPLEIEVSAHPSMLEVSILGFELRGGRRAGEICTDNYTPATRTLILDPDWLGAVGERQVIVSLRDDRNDFVMEHEPWALRMSAARTTNVELDRYWRGSIWDGKSVMVPMFGRDVAQIRAFGATQDELRAFARKQGWPPVDESYVGAPQHHSQERLYIVVRDRPLPEGRWDQEEVGTMRTAARGRQTVWLSNTRWLDGV